MTTERKYSLAEIDSMRRSIEFLLTQPGFGYDPIVRNAEIEGRLRTYMAAGVSPDDLSEASDKFAAAMIAAQRERALRSKP